MKMNQSETKKEARNDKTICLCGVFMQAKARTQLSLLYLQANTDSLGERPLWEGCLDHGHGAAGQHASIRAHVVGILLDPRHHSKILRKICRHNAANALLLQLSRTVQL